MRSSGRNFITEQKHANLSEGKDFAGSLETRDRKNTDTRCH